ncbi:mitochondrial carrier domain-containing protein [Pilobolus umbonatus]|nr:mitochondrial carrier domain-containing protein [Pilobolus umbonatus]
MSMKDYSNNNLHMNEVEEWKYQPLLQKNRTVIAASSAAVVSVLSGFPFDSIKTRMQTHYYPNIMSCVKITYAEEGARGFFRGMIPPLVTVSIIKSVSFSIYEKSKATLQADYGLRKDTAMSLFTLATISGSISGAFIALLSCPLELVKIQRQLELVLLKDQITNNTIPPSASSNSWTAVRNIIQKKGILGLWSGVSCHSARDALGTGIYFGGYESMKRLFSTDDVTGPMTHFFSGGICGTLSWLFVFPVDAVKTNLQKDIMVSNPKYTGFWDCTMKLVKKKGIKSLYRGLNVTLIRAFPIHSLNFLVYEQVLKLIPSNSPP